MSARNESCARCLYYDPDPRPRGETAEAYWWPADGLGACLRFPTAITKTGSSWCGEFTPPQDAATTRGEG
jgi:hypothetical protein